MHDAWLLSGHCAHSFECERWRSGCGACPDLSIPPAILRDSTADNWMRKNSIFQRSRVTVVTPSRWLMERVNQSMLVPAISDAHVIPNGVDLDLFAPGDRRGARLALGLPLDADVLLFAGSDIRRNPWKDYGMLRRAASRLTAMRPGRKLIFLGLGDTAPPESEGSLEMRFVPFTGDPALLPRYYAAADLFVHPARTDTFPNVVLEALACGRAVVATSVGGIPEQIRTLGIDPEPTGALVNPGNPQHLAETIARLLDDRDLLARMESNGVSDARLRFDLRKQSRAYLSVYEEMRERFAEPASL
jgi:glycosyltransferase involved in cell wall biosynthesis